MQPFIKNGGSVSMSLNYMDKGINNIIPSPRYIEYLGNGFKHFSPYREYPVSLLGKKSERLSFCFKWLSEKMKTEYSLNIINHIDDMGIIPKEGLVVCNDFSLIGSDIVSEKERLLEISHAGLGPGEI